MTDLPPLQKTIVELGESVPDDVWDKVNRRHLTIDDLVIRQLIDAARAVSLAGATVGPQWAELSNALHRAEKLLCDSSSRTT